MVFMCTLTSLFSSLIMTELLFPWCNTLVDLMSELGDSNPETSSIVIDSIVIAVLNGNLTIVSSLHDKLLPLYGKYNHSVEVHSFSLLW